MRIIAGSAGRRNFKVPKAIVRPTTDRTREAIFSMLSTRVDNASVLDLFAGSGSLGMEALSRGAKNCLFVEENRVCVNTVKDNLKALSLSGGKAVQSDVLRFIQQSKHASYDLNFADPPYYKNAGDRDFVKEMFEIESLGSLLADDGLIVIEVDERAEVSLSENWELIDRRKYGGCSILFIERK